MRVRILLSDPWDLGEAVRWQPIEGDLVRTGDDGRGGWGLIRLLNPIDRGGVPYRHVVASPRHEGDSLAGLLAGRGVFCGLIGVSEEEATGDSAPDTTRWRGGLAFIGTVEPQRRPL